jgi:hypothetical protein
MARPGKAGTGLSAPIPQPLRGLRDFRCNPSRGVARRGTAFGGSPQNVALWGRKHVLRCGRRLVCKRLLVTRAQHFDPILQPWLLPFSAVAAAGGDKDAHLPCKCGGGIPRDFAGQNRVQPGCMGEQQSCLQDCDQPLARKK